MGRCWARGEPLPARHGSREGPEGAPPPDRHQPPQPLPAEPDCGPEQGSHSRICSNSPAPSPRHPRDTLSGESLGPRERERDRAAEWQSGGGLARSGTYIGRGGVFSPSPPMLLASPAPSLCPCVHLQLHPPGTGPASGPRQPPTRPTPRGSPLLWLPRTTGRSCRHPSPASSSVRDRPGGGGRPSSLSLPGGQITISTNSAFGVVIMVLKIRGGRGLDDAFTSPHGVCLGSRALRIVRHPHAFPRRGSATRAAVPVGPLPVQLAFFSFPEAPPPGTKHLWE